MPDDLIDARLEREIAQAKRAFDVSIGDPDALRAAWEKLSALVKQRSEAQAAKMEKMAGLNGR